MKYMLLIYGNEDLWSSFPQEEFQKLVADTDALHEELRGTGEYVCAFGVGDQALAKTVHIEDGAPVVSDGPYIETKEYLGSFDIVECDTFERALEIAAKVPSARFVKVEVRPIMHEPASDL